jgi:osmotically-inducible protein OsmY
MMTKAPTHRAMQALRWIAGDMRSRFGQMRERTAAQRSGMSQPGRTAAEPREDQAPTREEANAPRRPRNGIVLLAAAAGAVAAYVFDPDLGARRRALLRDKARHARRVIARRMRGAIRTIQGRGRGAVHETLRRTPLHRTSPPDMDMYVKQRVESELGHEPDLPLSEVNFDAVDGLVRVRGTVPNADTARRIVQRVLDVEPVKAVVSLLHTPSGLPVGGAAGDKDLIMCARAERLGESLEERLLKRWPQLTADDITASDGHVERLARIIAIRSGHPESEVRAVLDELLLSAALHSAPVK